MTLNIAFPFFINFTLYLEQNGNLLLRLKVNALCLKKWPLETFQPLCPYIHPCPSSPLELLENARRAFCIHQTWCEGFPSSSPHSRPTPTCTHTHIHTCPFSSHGPFLLTLLSQIMDHQAIKHFPALNPKDISPVSLIQQFAMDIFKCCFQLCMYHLTSLERH